MNVIENCLNCKLDGQCYECYILSGDEERDELLDKLEVIQARIAELEMQRYERDFKAVWCNQFATLGDYVTWMKSTLIEASEVFN
jgi:hypothetical protein